MSDYFISRAAQHLLVKLLREIPGLVEDLAVTICRLDRTGKGGIKVSSGSDEQPLPINLAASDAKDELHNELASWARHVCESRGLKYRPIGFTHDGDFIGPLRVDDKRVPYGYQESLLGLAHWLDTYIIALAMTEGSEEAYSSIEKAMGKCRRAMDIAPEDDVPVREKDDVLDQVGSRMLHRAGIVQVAALLARHYPEYRGLTENRVDSLRKGGHIVADRCGVVTQAEIFCMGQVLEKHLTVPTRAKKVAA
ncbi:hypothetical protein FFI94_018800 [Rhodococcus sp. KBS0724]|uniref:hypothetical protein n=1 Tax=Rhodococcus sp. KBS0724 TaxID=1179674 RepID=UPI00110E830C|nr:hypothetical protein [Rhodococcus sp. KBS0724]TSD47966.1 hypothetical protein FFI94_018800 [Rhodococcus sp. KBS0724]